MINIPKDSFLKIFDKIGQYKNRGSFEGWLKRIVINTALEKYRAKNIISYKSYIEKENDVEETDNNTTDYSVDILLRLVQNLPNKYRLVFNLYVLDKFTHKEISTMLGISEGTSKSNLSRARNLLQQGLKNLNKEK